MSLLNHYSQSNVSMNDIQDSNLVLCMETVLTKKVTKKTRTKFRRERFYLINASSLTILKKTSVLDKPCTSFFSISYLLRLA